MANDFLDVLSPSAEQRIKEYISDIQKLQSTVNSLNSGSKNIKLPSENRAFLSQVNNEIKKSISTRQQSIAVIERQRLAELKLQKSREKAFDDYEKQLAKETQALNRAESLYNKVQSKVNQLTVTYNNLATKKGLGLRLNDRENAQLASLESRLNRYSNVLKTVDANIGKSFRNVGNYASGFNPLNNAIGQIAREVPNLGQSFQIFAMSITNNVGALQDAISGLVAQNKALIAQGQPVKSVFSQVLGSILSLNTALYVGIAVFSAYGKEIGDWVSNLFNADSALKAVKESQDALSKSRVEGLKASVEEERTLRSNLSIAKDAKLSMDERMVGLKALRDQYPFYFKNLTDEEILLGKTQKAQDAVVLALQKRSEAEKINEQIVKNRQRVLDINDEELKNQNKLNKAQADYNKLAYGKVAPSQAENAYEKEANALGKVQELQRTITKLQEERTGLNGQNVNYEGQLLQLQKESSGLRAQYDKEESKKYQIEELRDFVASEYELTQTRLANQQDAQRRILESDEKNYNDRESALNDYVATTNAINESWREEQLRLINKNTADEIAAIEKRIREGEIREKNGRNAIYTLDRQAMFDRLKVQEEYNQRVVELERENQELLKGIYDKINFQKAQNLIDERQLNATQTYTEKLSNLVKINGDYRDIEKANKEFQTANRSITVANAQREIDVIETQLRQLEDTNANVEKRTYLEGELLKAQNKRSEAQAEQLSEEYNALKKLQTATESYLNKFSEGFLQDAGLESINTFLKIEENGKTTFQNLIAGANTTAEKFAVVFNTITSVAQEAFAFLQQNQQASFDAMYSRLEREKEINLKFAGESEAGRAEIERQYEERRREIRIKEAKAQKEQAIFNAIINTAQGVTAALAQANIPLSLIIGAIGAAQIALISSRELPAFKDGVQRFGGGLAWVGDGGRSEIIQTPSGGLFRTPDTDTLVNLPKGSNVYKDDLDFLRNSGALLGGMPHIELENGGISASDLDAILGRHLSNSTSLHVNLDKKGVNSWASTAHAKKVSHNNRVSFRGRSIS